MTATPPPRTPRSRCPRPACSATTPAPTAARSRPCSDPGPQPATLSWISNGSFTYTPAANFNGTDTFTYQARDRVLTSNVATVTITVVPVPDAPIARDDSYRANQDAPLTVPAPGVLANDS